ncbi:hypothetical protein R3W88_016137 [Solanum pinnatisectum]|uniref:Pectinesterase inhibitor domain-containing protein n=1 Tax=Solanum pinnatisectum TaxID=50273 RepID=A0AAV9KYZ0_9SOLN|nr:hypothetical protein R3W88_016137 [Solanum pinnatisectum]
MTTYSSSSSLGTTLILCLIITSLITPSTSNYLSQMCIKSKSPRFCLQVFGLNPHRRPYELTREAINLAFSNASQTKTKIHAFLDQTNDDNLKTIYNLCLDYYQSAIDVLTHAEEYYLKEGQYSNVHAIGKSVQIASFYCEKGFQTIPGYAYSSTLSKDNDNLENFGNIIVSAVNLLFNSP